MLLRVPDEIQDPLWTGALSLDAASLEVVQRNWLSGRGPVDPEDVARQLPLVSIGRPESWPIRELYQRSRTPVPDATRARLAEHDLHLLRLACSFRPVHKETRIEWARFAVSLRPDSDGNQPIAEDLHPNEVTQEIKRTRQVSLSPTVAFQEVEASLGSADVGVEYDELLPTIFAAGHKTPVASWDYSEAPGRPVYGGKWMHLVVNTPRAMTYVTADFDVTVDVATDGGLVRSILRRPKDVTEHLTVQLWGGGQTG